MLLGELIGLRPSPSVPLMRKLPARSKSSSHTVFVVENEAVTLAHLQEVLCGQGLSMRSFFTLSSAFKATHRAMPGALLINFSCDSVEQDRNMRTGCDHFLRVLRESYPRLCIVAINVIAARGVGETVEEFDIPKLTTPLQARALLSILRAGGVRLSSQGQ